MRQQIKSDLQHKRKKTGWNEGEKCSKSVLNQFSVRIMQHVACVALMCELPYITIDGKNSFKCTFTLHAHYFVIERYLLI